MSSYPASFAGLVGLLSMFSQDGECDDERMYRTEDELIASIKGKNFDSLRTDLSLELATRLLTANEALGLDTFDTFYWFYLRPNIPHMDGKTLYETYRDGDRNKVLDIIRLIETVSQPHEP